MSSIARRLPLLAALAFLADAAPAQEKNEPTIGTMMVQTIPARHYFYGSIETDFKSMGKPISATLGSMIKGASENKQPLLGPVMHYYYGAPHTAPDKEFKMETGFFVTEGTKPPGDFKVRELPKFKCATILYIGPATRIGDAWQKIYRSISDKGLTPTNEEREAYLYWEGVDSPNNIVQVMVGVK